MDKITPEIRSRSMSRIRSKNTKPELILRKLLYSKGYRYRIHYPLPGKPDIVFPSKKIENNKKRDLEKLEMLGKEKWRILTFWECDILQNSEIQFRKIEHFISD